MTPDLRGVRLVSWDVDGTLYSRRALERRWLAWHLRGNWLKAWRSVRDMQGYLRAIEAQRNTAEGRVDSKALERFEHRGDSAILATLLEQLPPNPKALGLLAQLADLGITQVVLSDLPSADKLKALGLGQRLPVTYDCQSLGYWKPSPVPFAHVQQRHGVIPTEHLHIGDRLATDGIGARRSGCRFFLLG